MPKAKKVTPETKKTVKKGTTKVARGRLEEEVAVLRRTVIADQEAQKDLREANQRLHDALQRATDENTKLVTTKDAQLSEYEAILSAMLKPVRLYLGAVMTKSHRLERAFIRSFWRDLYEALHDGISRLSTIEKWQERKNADSSER